MRTDIYEVLRNNFQSQIERHAMNVRIMMDNPMAIHDHTDYMAGIEEELALIAEYRDKLEALECVGIN